MVMSGGGQGDPRDDETTAEEAVVVDYSFQNHTEVILRRDVTVAPIFAAPSLTAPT